MTSINGVPQRRSNSARSSLSKCPVRSRRSYEVVGILDDEEGGDAYAVLLHEGTARRRLG